MISVIIRTYNEGRYLSALIEGIRKQKISRQVEVIIVDSGSIDDTVRIAEAGADKVVHIKKEKFTFGRSLNVGCLAATGSIFVFVSGHCVPANECWLSELIRPLDHPFVGITYGRQIGNETTQFSEKKVFEKYFPDHENHDRIPYYCNNANSALLADLWKSYQFDEDLPGLEDMHLAKRIIADGFRVKYCPQSLVFHLHHEKWSQIRRRYEREAIALREIMPEIHFYYKDALRYAFAAILRDMGSALKTRVFWKSIGSIIFYRFSQYLGSSKGNHRHRKLSEKDRIRYFYPK